MGTVIGLPLSGLITAQLGWPYVFYIFGEFYKLFMLPFSSPSLLVWFHQPRSTYTLSKTL